MKETLSFDDVLLIPQYSDIESRTQVDISSELYSNTRLSLPVISSPMDTVTERAMAMAMNDVGGMGIIHRYSSSGHQAEEVSHCLLYTSPSPRDGLLSRMPSSA